MYRLRTRPKYTPEQLAEVYNKTYDHTQWPDHIARVQKTVAVGQAMQRSFTEHDFFPCIADLSCGDAAIVKGINPHSCHLLGDFSPGYDYTGPIEETIHQLDHTVELFVLSETIEHLDDPEAVLAAIREKSQFLLLSTPKMTWPDPNIEHYWSFDDEAVLAMLVETGWEPVLYTESYTGLGYTYQIHGCK